ncbi:MAG: hypothetical protein HW392_1786 [Steroidobacteraceae bacterium]|nr:hypothetical protein [Steroidobacteraceae bacterium]
MKHSQIAALMLVVVAFTTQLAGISRDEPIQNPTNIPISWNADGKPTMERIQRAMIAGCAQRGWQCQATKPGEIRAVLHVRQHMAEALIAFNTESFSISYLNSSELRYNATKKTIHRKYNLWVVNLISDINSTIASAQ